MSIRIVVSTISAIQPNLIRVSAYGIRDVENSLNDKEVVGDYEIALNITDFTSEVTPGHVEINVDKFRDLLLQKIANLRNTVELARALEALDLTFELTEIIASESTPKGVEGSTLAHGE